MPFCIGVWAEKAIVDTGASYTMVQEEVWKKLTPHEKLQPWTLGALYLANGEAEVPLGWIHQQIYIHDHSLTLPIYPFFQGPRLLVRVTLHNSLFRPYNANAKMKN